MARRKLKAGRFAALAGDFWRNPKRHSLSAQAQALHAAAMSYSADQLTDGQVPDFMLPALAGGSAGGTAEELIRVGWWGRTETGYVLKAFTEYNRTKAEIEGASKRQAERAKSRWEDDAKPPPDATGNASGTTNGNALSQTPDPTPLIPDPKQAEPPPADSSPSLAEEISELEARYPASLPAEARESCALSRKNGKLADSVWLRTLRKLDAFPVDSVVHAMRTFVEKHADGDKSEAYMVAIARRTATRPGTAAGNATGMTPAPPANTFRDTPDDELDALFGPESANG